MSTTFLVTASMRQVVSRLDHLRDGGQTHIVCFLDLDQFKADTLARLGGDALGLILNPAPCSAR